MNTLTAYKASLSLPLLVPLLAAPLLSGGGGSPLQRVAGLFVGSLLVGGIPYAILAVALLVLLHDGTERRIRTTLTAAPLLMLPALWVYLAVAEVVTQWPAPRWSYLPEWAGFFGMCAVGLGYGYVGAVFAGIWLLRRLRVLT